jgi:GNAT superfamily N-acetyltransferase/protein tyrosine phosphatase (PTP) superfamily phosphohydrolase (DUF442 family)
MAIDEIRNFHRVDDRLGTGGQPTEAQLQDVAAEGFQVVINLGLLDPKYCLPDEAGSVAQLGMKYHHVPVVFDDPRPSDLDAFVAVMDASATARTFVHCAANWRVSAFVALYGQLRRGWLAEEADAHARRFWQPNDTWLRFLTEGRRQLRLDLGPPRPVAGIPVRTGSPGDLDTIVAIDDDACGLYAQTGLHVALPDDHPFTVEERADWRRSLEHGWTFVALDDANAPIGFASLDLIDGAPYLDQLSVRVASMRRGVGRALLARAVGWARAQGDSLWLTTYAHLPWNRPFYEKEGFVVVPAEAYRPGIAARLEAQRRSLPAPEHRIVMRRRWS